jgi:glycosyltransferase involved in cell wall biosynthesis
VPSRLNSERNVLCVLGELRRSGAEMMLLDALPDLLTNGARITVLSTGAEPGEMAPSLAAAGAEIQHQQFAPSPAFIVAYWRACRRADVVHVHTERASFWLCLLGLAARKRVLRTLHSAFPFDGWLRLKRKIQRRVLQRLGVIFVAVSGSVADNERVRFGLSPLVANNFASPRYAQLQRQPTPDRLRVLTIGNCGEPKNHEALIRALGTLATEQYPLVYDHIGDESAATCDERGLALSYGLDVCWHGSRDPAESLAAASLFVMPSVREGFGLAALEAMTAGVNVMLSRAPGLVEFADIPGVQWTGTDEQSIAQGLRDFFAESEDVRRRDAMSTAEAVRSGYSLDRYLSQMLPLYGLTYA